MIPLAKRLHYSLPGFRARQALRIGWSRLSFASPRALIEPYTMVSARKLKSLERAIRAVVRRDVPGEVVECGSAQGGSAALMALCLERLGSPKKVYLFDTFEGLPPPTDRDPEDANEWTGKCRGNLEDVTKLFESLGIRSRAVFVPGRFENTLGPHAPAKIAVLHLDADWYESTKVALEHLWDRVSPGGIVQFDDYTVWKGCRDAVEEFLSVRGITGCSRTIIGGALRLEKPPA